MVNWRRFDKDGFVKSMTEAGLALPMAEAFADEYVYLDALVRGETADSRTFDKDRCVKRLTDAGRQRRTVSEKSLMPRQQESETNGPRQPIRVGKRNPDGQAPLIFGNRRRRTIAPPSTVNTVGALLRSDALDQSNHLPLWIVKKRHREAITDVQISQKTKGGLSGTRPTPVETDQCIGGQVQQVLDETVNEKRYPTRVMSTANPVNLEYEEAAPQLNAGVTRVLTGLF